MNTMDRRSFLKASSLLGALALAGCSSSSNSGSSDSTAEGYTLPEDQQTSLASIPDTIASYAKDSGLHDGDEYMADYYGKGANVESYVEYVTQQQIASGYASDKLASFTYTDAEMESYYQEHKQDFDTVTYRLFNVSTADDDTAAAKSTADSMLADLDGTEKSFADAALMFRSGNPRPQGTADDIIAQGKRFYDELSPETSEFFGTMLDQQLMDVLSTEGKEGGGYCTSLLDYEVPFIFANFNGTQGDVEVITHEAGHAFEGWLNRARVPMSYIWGGMESCEVHSMSMEFFAWPWSEGFFGPDTRKFHYSHLASALTFIPYGTLVDHFQHLVYEKPEMTPAERNDLWRELSALYMPWLRLDGEIPFFSDGRYWQRQLHIYTSPFYYIDYCLAQTMSLYFWAEIQKDIHAAWEQYYRYTKLAGTKTFTELLAAAGLPSPFDEDTLRGVCEKAAKWLDGFDLTGIE